jgi:predicted nicotinamide N-methyase
MSVDDPVEESEDQDLVEEVIPLGSRDVSVLRPRDAEALLDEHAFEQEEFLPYWAELWPSGVALARDIAPRALHGKRVVELGCGGLALPSIAAAIAGGRVLATDWSQAAVERAAANARRNGVHIDTLVASWADPAAIASTGPHDLVLASDVLYERRDVDLLLNALDALHTEAWIADPGRPPATGFLEKARHRFTVTTTHAKEIPQGGIHRLMPT